MPFSADQVFCVLDYETYSEAPLKLIGGWEYACDPSTEILCVAFRIGTRESLKTAKTQTWFLGKQTPQDFSDLLRAMRNPKVMLVAHNALFEQVITKHVFAKKIMPTRPELATIGPERWVCTASLAAALALPRNLEGAAKALKLPVQKDMEGNRLIQKWCKPRKPSKTNPSTRHNDHEEFAKIVAYCATDVDTTVELFLRCPPLTDTERRVWILDQNINMRGFLTDRPLVSATLKMIEDEVKHINRETEELSLGLLESATQRAGVLKWLEGEGVFLPDLRKKTVEDAIKEGMVEGDAKTMLELRLAISKTSTAKYQAFEMRSRTDGRVRDILLYWAASTGRWGGRGVQPQNLKRPTMKQNQIDFAIKIIKGEV